MPINGTITIGDIARPPSPAPQQPAPVKPPTQQAPKPASLANVLQAKGFKITAVIEPEAIASLRIPNGQPRLALRIVSAGRTLKTDVACKSLRKVQAALAEHGPDGVTIIVQGKLEGETLSDAGIAAQLKTPKA